MKPISRDILRIIDASLNRIGEGLRVLEEYARFSLDEAKLTQQLKNMRHKLVKVDSKLQSQLIHGRDAGIFSTVIILHNQLEVCRSRSEFIDQGFPVCHEPSVHIP